MRNGIHVLSIAMLVMTGEVARAAFTTPACLAKKRTTWGNLRKCQASEEAKQLQGKPADLTKCQAKFDAKLAATSDKATTAGIPCHYADHGDGTVIDYDAGLQWEKKTPGSCSGVSLLCLQDTDCPVGTCAGGPHYVNDKYTWGDARVFVDGTSSDGTALGGTFAGFAGHFDWRLPTIEELKGILDLGALGCASETSPCIDPIFGPTIANLYWSATSRDTAPSVAWFVRFRDGFVGTDAKDGAVWVRGVRTAL